MKFTVSTDSCCDGFKEDLKAKGVRIMPMAFITGDYERRDNFNTEKDYMEFYQELSEGKKFKTAALNVTEMEDYFMKILAEEKKDVLHITLSSGLSATYDNTVIAAKNVNEKCSNKIYVIDSLAATMLQYLYVINALSYRDQGYTVAEAVSMVEADKKRVSLAFFVDELDTLKRGGRISPVSAAIGKLAQVKPIISFDNEGKLVTIAKVIGTKRALMTLFNRFMEEWDEESDIVLVYGTSTELFKQLYNHIALSAPKEKIHKVMIGPVIGAHTGGTIIGVTFLKK